MHPIRGNIILSQICPFVKCFSKKIPDSTICNIFRTPSARLLCNIPNPARTSAKSARPSEGAARSVHTPSQHNAPKAQEPENFSVFCDKSSPTCKSNPHKQNRLAIRASREKFGGFAATNVAAKRGGDKGIRTPDLLHAKQALSQLSYTPVTQ